MSQREEFVEQLGRLAGVLNLTERRDRSALYQFSRSLLRAGFNPGSEMTSRLNPGRTYMELEQAIRELEQSWQWSTPLDSVLAEIPGAWWPATETEPEEEGGTKSGQQESDGLLHSARLFPAVLVRLLRANSARDSLAYLMMVVMPAIIVAVHFWAYLFIVGSGAVMGMPLLPFLILGVAGWYLFRMPYILMGVEANRARHLVALPGVNMLTVLLAKWVEVTLGYTLVAAVALGVLTLLGSAQPPANLLLVACYWGLLALAGFGFGLFANAMRDIFPAFNHFAVMVFRPGYWVSGIVFVSEQMPPSIRSVIIFNPILHLMQLIRSAYFLEYRSQDASPLYAVMFVMTILLIGLVAEQRRSIRVRALA